MREVSLIIFAVGAALCGCRQGSGEQNVSVVDSAIAVGDSVIITEVDSAVVDSVVTEPEPVEAKNDLFEFELCDDSYLSYLSDLEMYNQQLEKQIEEIRERLIQRGFTEPLPEIPRNESRNEPSYVCNSSSEASFLARQDSLKVVLAELEAIMAAAKKKRSNVAVAPTDSTYRE